MMCKIYMYLFFDIHVPKLNINMIFYSTAFTLSVMYPKVVSSQ